MKRRSHTRLAPARFALLAGVCLGCGGLESSVSGVITVDGEPASSGRVAFEPVAGGKMASARIGDAGRYQLQSNQTAGLAPGEYRVSVTIREPLVRPAGGGLPAPGALLIPEKYTRTSTSGLSYSVNPGANEFDIELTNDESSD